jgi:LUD domain
MNYRKALMSDVVTILRPNPEFAVPASRERLEAAAAALREHGFRATVARDRDEARKLILDQIPDGAEVYQSATATLEAIGVTEEIERSGRYDAVRPKLLGLDRETQGDEIRRVGAAPDYMLGSVHAVTEDGSLVVASAGGSQIGPEASGAGRVIFAVGSQKIVPDLETALRRVREYSYPLEDERALKAYGIHSAINELLIISGDWRARISVVLIDEPLGF